MKFAAVSFVSSSRMASFQSCANRRRRCLTGFAPSLTFRQCSIASRGTLGMSEGFQAKMSWFAWRKVTSALSYLSLRPVPIRAVLVGSDGLSVIFLTSWSALIPALAVEMRAAPFQLGVQNLHVVEGLGEEDVKSATAVDKDPVKFDHPDDWIQHQGIASWVRNMVRMVGPTESDWGFQP